MHFQDRKFICSVVKGDHLYLPSNLVLIFVHFKKAKMSPIQFSIKINCELNCLGWIDKVAMLANI